MNRPMTPDALPLALAREEAEQSVLGACLMDPAAVVRARALLAPADFVWPGHGELFAAVCEVTDADSPVDRVTVTAALDRRGTLRQIGDAAYLGFLTDVVATSASVEHHAKLVADAARRRKLVTLAESLVDVAEDAGADVVAETARVAAELLPLGAGANNADGFHPLSERLYAVFEQIERRSLAKPGDPIFGVQTGFPEFDEHFGGWRPGELIIVGAAPKHGKSTLAFQSLRHVIERGHAGVVSAEMTRDEITEGLIAMESGVARERLARGKVFPDEWPLLARAAGNLKPALARLHVDDVAFPSLNQVVTRCVRLKAEHPEIAFLVVDYLQLITNPLKGRRGDEEISAVCVALKGLAKRLGIPVLAPAQVNYKDTAKRKNKRPTLADLQGSSGMAQTANFVMLLYRPAMDRGGVDDVLEVELAASRRTDRMSWTLGWDGARMRVTSRAPRTPSQPA